MWQTLERKARFIHDVTTRTLDAREIADVGDTVLTFSEAKALATGNPLLMDKAEADAELARLVRAERAHGRNHDSLRHAVRRHERNILSLDQHASEIDDAIARRVDTRGDKFAMTIDGEQYDRRVDAGNHLIQILNAEASALKADRTRSLRIGEFAGFPLDARVDRSLGAIGVSLELDEAPGVTVAMTPGELADTDPSGLITRLEYRLHRLEQRKASTLADIDRARREIDHATSALASPSPLAAELRTVRDRVRRIEDQLAQLAAQQSDSQRGTAVATADTRQGSQPQCPRTPHRDIEREADLEAGR